MRRIQRIPMTARLKNEKMIRHIQQTRSLIKYIRIRNGKGLLAW